MANSHRAPASVYRRCACRCAGKQLGAHCPELTSNARHGTWTFAVDIPSLTGKRATMRRGGYPTRKAATAALTRVPGVRNVPGSGSTTGKPSPTTSPRGWP